MLYLIIPIPQVISWFLFYGYFLFYLLHILFCARQRTLLSTAQLEADAAVILWMLSRSHRGISHVLSALCFSLSDLLFSPCSLSFHHVFWPSYKEGFLENFHFKVCLVSFSSPIVRVIIKTSKKEERWAGCSTFNEATLLGVVGAHTQVHKQDQLERDKEEQRSVLSECFLTLTNQQPFPSESAPPVTSLLLSACTWIISWKLTHIGMFFTLNCYTMTWACSHRMHKGYTTAKAHSHLQFLSIRQYSCCCHTFQLLYVIS